MGLGETTVDFLQPPGRWKGSKLCLATPEEKPAEAPRIHWRVLTKDRPEYRGFFEDGFDVVVEVMVSSQRQINHFFDLGDDFCASTKSRNEVANVAVVLFDGDGQVFSGEELILGDETVVALPIVGDKRFTFDADFVEELLTGSVITATKNPGDGSPSNRVIGSPNPKFCSLFFYKMPHLVERDDQHVGLG